MKKILIITILTLLWLSALSEQSIRVAMLEPIGNATPIQKRIIRAELTSAITNSGAYEAFTRTDIDRIVEEFRFQDGGMVDDRMRQEIGRMSGAELICIIRLTVDGTDFFVEAEFVEIQTGRIVRTAHQLMPSSPNTRIQEGCKELAAKIVEQSREISTAVARQTPNASNSDIAILHIYRPSLRAASNMSWDIYFGDVMIGTLRNNTKNSIRIRNLEENRITAVRSGRALDHRSRLVITIDFEAGQEYYVRLAVVNTMNAVFGISRMDNTTGRAEFDATK